MTSFDVLSNVVGVIIFIGGPLIPLLLLAAAIGRWHRRNGDPPEA